MPNIRYRPKGPVVPAGRGEKNNDRIRVRNRRYKIKRFMLQPRDVEVKHNGRVVRRMHKKTHNIPKYSKKTRILELIFCKT